MRTKFGDTREQIARCSQLGNINFYFKNNHSELNSPSKLLSTHLQFARSVNSDPSGRAVQVVGLRLLVYWDCGFESRRGHRCLSVVSVVCLQARVCATGRSLVQRSLTACGVSECDHESSIIGGLDPMGLLHREKKSLYLTIIILFYTLQIGARGSVVVKALCQKSVGPGIDSER